MTPQVQLLTMEDVEVIRKQIRVGDNLVTSTRILQLADSYEYVQQRLRQCEERLALAERKVDRLTREIWKNRSYSDPLDEMTYCTFCDGKAAGEFRFEEINHEESCIIREIENEITGWYIGESEKGRKP